MHIRIVDVISLLGFVSNASTVCSDIVCSEQLILGTFIRNQIYAFMFGTFNFGTSCMY